MLKVLVQEQRLQEDLLQDQEHLQERSFLVWASPSPLLHCLQKELPPDLLLRLRLRINKVKMYNIKECLC